MGRSTSDAEWERHKAEIRSLYLDERKSAQQVKVHMEETHCFCETINQYRQQFKKWDFKKNSTGDDWKFASQRVHKRTLDGKDSDIYMHGSLISEKKRKKEIARHVPLSFPYSCTTEPQTPEGVSVCTPAAAIDLDIPSSLESLPCFQFQNLIRDKFNLGTLWIPGPDPDMLSSLSRTMPQLPQFNDSLDDLPYLNLPTPDGLSVLDFNDIFPAGYNADPNYSLAPDAMNFDMATPSEADLISEESLQDARRLLLDCANGQDTRLPRADNINGIASSLEPVMIEQTDGDLTQNAKKLFGSSKSDALLHFFQFCVYLSSNNLMSDDETHRLLRWITTNGFRPMLKGMFKLKTTTVEVFASNLLRTAVRQEDIETTRLLIEAGVETDAPGGLISRRTALQEAVSMGNTDVVRMLLEAGADPNAAGGGESPLHSAFDKRQTLELVRMLLDAGADPSPPQNPERLSPLQLAVGSMQLDVVRLLLVAKSDPNAFTTSAKGTALQLACARKNPEIVEALLNAGADIDTISSGNFAGPCEHESDCSCNLSSDVRDFQPYRPPIQIAAENGRWETLQVLLEEGAGINLPLSMYPKGEPREIIRSCVWRWDDGLDAVCCGTDEQWDEVPVFSPLQAAVRSGNVTMARLLLSAGAHVDARPGKNYGFTALQIAAFVQEERLVRILLQKGADVNAIAGPVDGYTALQAAATHDRTELLTLLLEFEANVNAPPGEEYGGTALQVSTSRGNIEAVEILINAGADVNAAPSPVGGRTALQAAIRDADGAIGIVKLLLKARADVNAAPAGRGGITALQAAVKCGCLEIVDLLLASGGSINPFFGQTEYDALLLAVRQGNIEIATTLLSNGADPNIFGSTGTPLQEAASEGNLALIRLLLTWGADVNAPANHSFGRTALQAAIMKRSLAVVKELFEAGADVNAPGASRGGTTALRAAISVRSNQLVRFLLDHGATLPVAGNNSDTGILGLAIAWWCVDEDLIEMLIKAGADVNETGLWNNAKILQKVVSIGNYNVVRMLLAAGANVNGRSLTSAGPVTALQAAAKTKNIDIVQALLDRGAEINIAPNPNSGFTALQAAVSVGSFDIVKLLLQKGADVNAPASRNHGRTALQEAAINGHIRLVQYLLQCRADVNAPAAHSHGVTALQGASIAGNIRIVMMLLTAGADVNGAPAMVNGRTAIEGAAENGRLDTLHLLLNYHSDEEDLEPKRKRAVKMAVSSGHYAIARFIQAYKKR